MEDIFTKIEKLNQLQTEIFGGTHIDVNVDDKISKICNDLTDNNNYYEEGYIENNYNMSYIKDLLKIAQPSKFGRGTETLYDPNVRNSSEILASEIDPKFIKDIQDCIVIKLLAKKYILKPYKLVIYEKGCFFSSHKDTIRGPKHIGTVSCILDSNYEGGEFTVQHGDKTHSVSGKNKWIAIYGDIYHEVTKVTYGTRISFLFDIYLPEEHEDEGIEILRSKIDENRVEELLEIINEKFENYTKVVIGMFHEYSKAQLDAKDLKNKDNIMYNILKNNFNVTIEILKHYQSVYEDDVNDSQILDITGKLSDCYVSFNESVYNEGPIFIHGHPHTGNDGGDVDNLYIWGVFILEKKE
jgi:hypothetical protein